MSYKNLKYYNSKSYLNFYNYLKKKTFSSSIEEVEKKQIYKLKQTLSYVLKKSKFYKQKYKNSFLLKDIKQSDDINKIPLISKQEIIDSYPNFAFKKKNYLTMTTGGTSGNPLTILMNEDYKSKSLALTFFYMSCYGLNPIKDKGLRIHGDITKNSDNYEIKNNNLVLSGNHIDKDNIIKFVKIINEFKPVYIHAYPSSIYLFTKLLKEFSLKINCELRQIITDSENLYLYQKKMLEKFYKCKVQSIYGHTEGALFGMTLEGKRSIHIHPAVGILQLLDSQNKEIKETNKVGQIVVSGFLNKCFPLIRYKTNDYGSYYSLTKGNFSYRVLNKIDGRLQDFALNKKSNIIPLGPLLFDYNLNWKNIEKFKIIQNKIGFLEFHIILIDMKKKMETTEYLKKDLRRVFKNNFYFSIKIKKILKNTPRGKFKYLEQKININKYL